MILLFWYLALACWMMLMGAVLLHG